MKLMGRVALCWLLSHLQGEVYTKFTNLQGVRTDTGLLTGKSAFASGQAL